ncbi:MAG: HDIG domain-containing protein [Candidatus Marinimicrobia bacterium]|jgi:hypothetical protein|nr:HDIG domain-containing protein [Candidatus Neomarinimicrobiota bacterium]MDP6593433.1 HDIG domain-containing protein [Candidatus Neomarinimicrobiota bacterium]MDP6836534.1 HDIG domain-containing protein [Candidatus Neomarinimicrobiota bacterium]|tara:strand:- start:3358 stop:5694 length:2337 start_codon:yes stop_codon:yes gene_type:complete
MPLRKNKEQTEKKDPNRQAIINRILIFGGLTLLLSLFFKGGKSLEYNYQSGDITREEIVAEFNFPILKKDEDLKADIEEAFFNEPFRFERKKEIVEEQIAEMSAFIRSIKDLSRGRKTLQETRQRLWEKRYGEEYEEAKTRVSTDSAALATIEEDFRSEYQFDVTEPEWEAFIELRQPDATEINLDEFEEYLINICRNRWAEGILDINKTEIKSAQVAIVSGDVSELMEINDCNDLEQAWTKARVEITDIYPEEENILREIGYKIIVEFMSPNVVFNREETERRQQLATAKVPRYQGIVMENERIVDANTRVTPEILLKLKSYQSEIDKREKTQKGIAVILPWIGRFLLVGIILSFFLVFLGTYRLELFEDIKILLLFSLMFLIMVGVSYLFVITFGFSEYLIPFTVAAMVLTVLFDGRIAAMFSVSLAVLVAFLIGSKLDYAVVSLFTTMSAILAVRKLRTRAQLFSAILYIVSAGIVALLALGILKRIDWTTTGNDILFILISGILAPFITYGLSALFEILFDVTSDLTLLELTDFNHPLLKKLSQEANGTFNHSVVVGNLAESCAAAVGANALLCRVGAYYHDIGKLSRPEYYIENQFSGVNRHDEISPSLSARIIASHVKEGLKLSKEYSLPSAVSDFIPMHHGTSRMEYFYQKALKQAEKDSTTVNETDFRYSGPRPNTRETGILMICESVEAATRSLKNPDLNKIEAMVDKITEEKLKEGQLDECPLTMKDLAKIKGDVRGVDGMLPVIRGIYHLRIEYPGQTVSSSKSDGQ